jgi:hypothetical protein
MKTKLMTNEMVREAMPVHAPSGTSQGSRTLARVGSPTHPSASEARVMPSWLADRYAGRRLMMPESMCARRPPCLTSSCTRVGRSLTMANSEATKKALAATMSPVRMSATLVAWGPSVLYAARNPENWGQSRRAAGGLAAPGWTGSPIAGGVEPLSGFHIRRSRGRTRERGGP